MRKKQLLILRWVAVLPVALLSIVAVGLSIDACLWILAALVPDNYFALMPQGLVSAIKAFLVTFAGMLAGVEIAPKKKFAAAVALAAINTLSYIAIFAYVYGDRLWSSIRFTMHFWAGLQVIAAIAAALFACSRYYAYEEN